MKHVGAVTLICFLIRHLSKRSIYVCYAPLAACTSLHPKCRLTAAVGQSIHGVAFVAETLKTTRVVHTCVITCPLEKTLVYICNQNRAENIIAGQSVAALNSGGFFFPPPTSTAKTLTSGENGGVQCNKPNKLWMVIKVKGGRTKLQPHQERIYSQTLHLYSD